MSWNSSDLFKFHYIPLSFSIDALGRYRVIIAQHQVKSYIITTIQLVYEFLTIYSLQKEECSSQCQQPQSTNLIRSEPNVSSNCNSPSLVVNLLMAATVFSLELLNCSQRLSSFSCMLDNSWSWKIVMKQTNINTHIQSWNNQTSSKVHLTMIKNQKHRKILMSSLS